MSRVSPPKWLQSENIRSRTTWIGLAGSLRAEGGEDDPKHLTAKSKIIQRGSNELYMYNLEHNPLKFNTA